MSRWVVPLVLLGLACGETDEVRAWRAHRDSLERRVAELREVETRASEAPSAWRDLHHSLDLAAFVRDAGLSSVHVFSSPGQWRASVDGPVEDCHAALLGLAPVRWLVPHWSLRLEGGGCRWEGRTNDVFQAIEAALFTPAPRWSAPAPSWRSRGVNELREQCRTLTAQLAELEVRLGPELSAGERPTEGARLVAQLRSAPLPCDTAILARELAQDVRGALLEATDERLIHPLEPRGDPRLRGLATGGPVGPQWSCP